MRWTRALLTALNADTCAPETGPGGWGGGALREALSRRQAEVWICAGLPRAHTLAITKETLGLLADSLATAQACGVRCALLILGDGAYRDSDAPWGCRESDPLGGRSADGFAQSCLRLLAEGFRAGYWGKPLPVAIAHHSKDAVTCGGMAGSPAQAWLSALARGDAPLLPEQTMPFQHALEAIGGALQTVGRILSLPLHGGDTWNFGVPAQGWLSPRAALQILAEATGFPLTAGFPLSEAPLHTGKPAPRIPRLDSEKARRHLGWRTVYDAEATLRLLAAWHVHAQAHGADAAYAAQAEAYLGELSKPQA